MFFTKDIRSQSRKTVFESENDQSSPLSTRYWQSSSTRVMPVRERGHNDVLQTASLHLGEDCLLIFDGVAAQLSHSALSDGVVEDEEI